MFELFDGKLRECMMSISPELSELSQVELEEIRKPTETDYKLRERLWFLIENAQKAQISHIQAVRVCEGILSEQRLFSIIENQPRLAWIMLRPVEDQKKMATLLQQMLQKIENEVLPKTITDNNLGAYLKLLEFLTNRVHGPLIQRVDARHAHVNLNKPVHSTLPPDDQQKRLGELKEKLLQAKDVTPGTPNAD